MKRVIDRMREAKDTEVPWEVWRLWGRPSKRIGYAGNQVSLGEDYATEHDIRAALEWYVDQFGGKVKWHD